MTFFQSALLMLFVFWILQVIGTWIQWSHFRQAFNAATRRWSDGYVGIGRGKGRWGRSAIALLEVNPSLGVRDLRMMSGISVFARFKPVAGIQGMSLQALRGMLNDPAWHERQRKAVMQAIDQVEEVRSRRT